MLCIRNVQHDRFYYAACGILPSRSAVLYGKMAMALCGVYRICDTILSCKLFNCERHKKMSNCSETTRMLVGISNVDCTEKGCQHGNIQVYSIDFFLENTER